MKEKMSLRKTIAILLVLLLAGMAMVPIVSAENITLVKQLKSKKAIEALQSNKSVNGFQPSKEFLDYMNAPVITMIEIDQCKRLLTDSKDFEKFNDRDHGPVNVGWAYPFTGKQRITTIVGSENSDIYGLYYAEVDLKSDSILDEGFVNWKKYW